MNTQDQKKSTSVTIVAIGDGCVGKTCMLVSYRDDKFPEAYVPTSFDNLEKVISMNGQEVKLNLWDTAGQENYSNQRKLSYAKADAFLIIFAIDNSVSLENAVDKWYPELNDGDLKNIPKIFVCNKIDLENTLDEEAKKKLEKDVKKKIQDRKLPYYQCSAMTQQGLKEVINFTIDLVLKKRSNGKKEISQQDGKHEELCCIIS